MNGFEELKRLARLDRDYACLRDACEFVANKLFEGITSEYSRLALAQILKLTLKVTSERQPIGDEQKVAFMRLVDAAFEEDQDVLLLEEKLQ